MGLPLKPKLVPADGPKDPCDRREESVENGSQDDAGDDPSDWMREGHPAYEYRPDRSRPCDAKWPDGHGQHGEDECQLMPVMVVLLPGGNRSKEGDPDA